MDAPRPLRIHKVALEEDLGDGGGWGFWRCEVEMSDGTYRWGYVQGDEHSTADETLELDDSEPEPKNA